MENNEMQNEDLNFNNRIPLEDLKNAVDGIKRELSKVIIGQENFIELLIVSLLVDGHVLIEGVPGIAKTITAKLFAKTLEKERLAGMPSCSIFAGASLERFRKVLCRGG